MRPFLATTGTLAQGVNWAVKADYAMPLFEELPALTPTQSKEEATQRALQATCVVETSP